MKADLCKDNNKTITQGIDMVHLMLLDKKYTPIHY